MTDSPLPPTLTVVAYDDPALEAHGHHPASAYVDWCWAPIIGPSSLLLYRRLSVLLDAHHSPEPLRVDTLELVASIGLGPGLGRHGMAGRTIARLAAFDIIRRHGDTIAVRRALPHHGPARAGRLPRLSRLVHDRHPAHSA
jgi:hypothetical protein